MFQTPAPRLCSVDSVTPRNFIASLKTPGLTPGYRRWFRRTRVRYHITVNEVAEVSGYSASHVTCFETGRERHPISPEAVYAFTVALGILRKETRYRRGRGCGARPKASHGL